LLGKIYNIGSQVTFAEDLKRREENLFADEASQKQALALVHKMLQSGDKADTKSAVVIIQTFQLYKKLNITTSLQNTNDEASLIQQFESLSDPLKRQVKLYVKEVTNDQLRLSRALKWTSKTQTESIGTFYSLSTSHSEKVL
jgi:hypothetical protein